MVARQAAVLAVAVSALALGASACGGGASTTKTSAAQEQTVEAKWRAGLFEWRRSMLEALDGLSVVFSTDASLAELSHEGSRASTGFARYRSRLLRCAAAVRRLGPVPPPYEQAQVYALQACRFLEQGIGKVTVVVGRLRRGAAVDPMDPLGNASVLLATGQTELTTAVQALDASSA
jgi:hypothetical protein